MSGVLEVRNYKKLRRHRRRAPHRPDARRCRLRLIGPNGAGKTSLFAKPDTVLLDGSSLDGHKFHQRARRPSGPGSTRASLPVIDNLLIGTHDYPGERLANVLFGLCAPARARQGSARKWPFGQDGAGERRA